MSYRDDEDFEDRPSRRRRRRDDGDYTEQPHRGTMVMLLGIGGIVLPIAFGCAPVGIIISIMAWIWGKKDLALMDNGEMDPDGRSSTQAGMICGIIGTIINGLYMVVILVYIIILAGFLAVAANAPPPPQQAAPPMQAPAFPEPANDPPLMPKKQPEIKPVVPPKTKKDPSIEDKKKSFVDESK